jgi:antitoxin ParD1/3/4
LTFYDIGDIFRSGNLMNVSLTPELEKMVDRKVSSGMYQTASEVIREGLRLLAERDAARDSLRRDIKAGFDAVERGEYTDCDAAGIKKLVEGVKKRGRERWEAEQAKHSKK